MAACHVGVRLLTVALVLFLAAGQPFPFKPVPVQICTTTDGQIFSVMRDNVLFLPPDQLFYVARQLWRESLSSSTTHTSLQIYQPDTALSSLNTVNPRRFIVRDGSTQPTNFPPSSTFQSFASERRLFQVRKCDPGQGGPAPVTYFSMQGSVLNVLSTQLDNASNLLRLSIISKNEAILCTLSNLQIQEFPSVVPSSGTPHPLPPMRRRRSIGGGPIRVQLLVDYGNERFVVSVWRPKFSDTYELRISPYRATSCTIGTAFYYKGYNEYHVSERDGTLVRRPAFTLQHVSTRLYVTSDVLDNMALNISGPGVTLKNETEFDTELSGFPDYRYFSRYDDQALNFRNSYEPLKRNTTYYRREVRILCPVHHRRYCLLPAKSGPLKLVPASLNDTSPYPTLADPAGGFFNFLEQLNGSSIIPTFVFLPV